MRHITLITITYQCLQYIISTYNPGWELTKDYYPFKNKLVFITGGTTGIGLGTAVVFASQGAHVVVCGRHKWKFENVAVKKLNSYNIPNGYLNIDDLSERKIKNRLLFKQKQKLKSLKSGYVEQIPCDIRQEGSMKQVMETIFGNYGRLDHAINNAGVGLQQLPSFVGENDDFINKLNNAKIDTIFTRLNDSISFAIPERTTNCEGRNLPKQAPAQAFGAAGFKFTKNDDGKCCPAQSDSPISDYCENILITNLLGLYNSLKWEIRYMRGSVIPGGVGKGNPPGDNSIINVCSVENVMASPFSLYSSSKGGCLQLSKSVGVEQTSQVMSRYGDGKILKTIRVNAIGPAGVDAALQRGGLVGAPGKYCKESYKDKAKELGMDINLSPEELYELNPDAFEPIYKIEVYMFGGKIQPLGRMLDPEEMGNTMAFMASSQGSAFVGSNIYADGGLLSIFRGIGLDPLLKCP